MLQKDNKGPQQNLFHEKFKIKLSDDTSLLEKIKESYEMIQPKSLQCENEGLFYIQNQFFYSNEEEIKYYIKQKYNLIQNLDTSYPYYDYQKNKAFLAFKILQDNTQRQNYLNMLRVRSLIHQSQNLDHVYNFRMSRVFCWNVFRVSLDDFETCEILEIDILNESASFSKNTQNKTENYVQYGSHMNFTSTDDNKTIFQNYKYNEGKTTKQLDLKINCFYEHQISLQQTLFTLQKNFKKDFVNIRGRPFQWQPHNNKNLKKCFTHEESQYFFDVIPKNYIIPIIDDRIIPFKSSFREKAIKYDSKTEVWLQVGSTTIIEALDSNFKSIQNVFLINNNLKLSIQDNNILSINYEGLRTLEIRYEFSCKDLPAEMINLIKEINNQSYLSKSAGIFILDPQTNCQVYLDDPLYVNII